VADANGARDPFKAAARPFGWVAVLALAFMVLMTCADVAMRGAYKVLIWFFGADAVYPYIVSIQGTVDLMELALTICVFLALPGVFLRNENIAVDLIDGLGRRGLTFALQLIGLALALGFLVLALTQLWAPALDRFRSGEGTMTLQLPRWWQAVPIMLGFACSALAVLFVAARVVRRGPARAFERTRTSLD
jgi:TRAP-type C4-dicarboxylate transport system permease small subunit